MLQNVRTFWIKGVLEQSLYAVARLELGLTTQPNAVADVWNVLLQRPGQIPQSLPPGTRISTAFDEFGQTLLILGAPGTGKTTLLLELTKDLLARAEQDPNHPLPVVFNLASWAVRQSPLSTWLVDELCERYQVPRKHAQTWTDKELILPLLDGLESV
jgi:predicted NACHT family NTPase